MLDINFTELPSGDRKGAGGKHDGITIMGTCVQFIHSMKLMPNLQHQSHCPSRGSVIHHPKSSSRILYANPVTTFWTSLWKRSVDTVYVNTACVHTCSTAQVLPHPARGVCSETFLNLRPFPEALFVNLNYTVNIPSARLSYL